MPHDCILVTGFEPFGGQTVNPSWLCVSALPDTLAGVRVERRLLPVDWHGGPAALLDALRETAPAAVLCVGQAGGRAELSLERVAVNLRAGADNAGVAQDEQPVAAGGPAAYFSTLPCAEMLAALRAQAIPAACSYSAGVYLCNCVMYTALHFAAAERPALRAGFLHVPFLPEQTQTAPSMARETMARGVLLCAEVLARHV